MRSCVARWYFDHRNQHGTPMPSNADVGEIVVPVLAEQLEVGRRSTVTGNTIVATKTKTREQFVDELLTDEHVEVEHVPCGRFVEEAPSIREEGETTIIPVIEERVVIERRLYLKEEVHVRRVKVEHRHQETVTLRQQEAVVTRTLADDPAK